MVSLVNMIAWYNKEKYLFERVQVFRSCVSIAFAVTLGTVVCSIPRGLGYSDESWYLILLRDQISTPGSTWSLFFARLPQNILAIRVITLIMIAMGNAVFGYSVYAFFRKKFNLSSTVIVPLVMVAFIGSFCFGNAVCLVPCYSQLNHFIIQIGIGFTLLGAAGASGWFLLSGLSLGFIPFVMITNTPILLVAPAFILCTQKKIGILFFLAGALVAFLFYFTVVQSPAAFQQLIQDGLSQTHKNSEHGLLPMIKWSVSTVRYVMVDIIMVSFMAYFLKQRIQVTSGKIDGLSGVALLILAAYFLMPYLVGRAYGLPAGIYTAESIAVLTGLLIVDVRRRFGRQDWAAIALLVTVPVLAALGTDVDFSIRGARYIGVFWGTLGVCFLLSSEGASLRMFGCGALALMALGFVVNFFSPNWSTRESLSKCTASISDLVPNITVGSIFAQRVSAIKNYIGESRDVVISDRELWHFVYLLKLNPLSYDFDCSDPIRGSKFTKLVSDKLIMVERLTHPFPAAFWSEIGVAWRVDDDQQIDNEIKVYRAVRKSRVN